MYHPPPFRVVSPSKFSNQSSLLQDIQENHITSVNSVLVFTRCLLDYNKLINIPKMVTFFLIWKEKQEQQERFWVLVAKPKQVRCEVVITQVGGGGGCKEGGGWCCHELSPSLSDWRLVEWAGSSRCWLAGDVKPHPSSSASKTNGRAIGAPLWAVFT